MDICMNIANHVLVMMYLRVYHVVTLWCIALVLVFNLHLSTSEKNDLYSPPSSLSTDDSSSFSGIYVPSTLNTEVFGGALLVHVNRFMEEKTLANIYGIRKRGIEQALLAFLFYNNNTMTRDYMDFQVVHLSSTLNQIPGIRTSYKIVGKELLYRMNETVKALQSGSNTPSLIADGSKVWRIADSTVALIPFSTTPGSMKMEDLSHGFILFSDELKLLFLRATVLSVARYFPKVIITVSSNEDLKLVKSLSLPVWKYVDLSKVLEGKNPMLLPKESMLFFYNKYMAGKKKSNEWSGIKYMYYTEADQILYARGLPHIYDILDRMSGSIVMVPHRMHTTALVKSFPREMHTIWKNSIPKYTGHPSRNILDQAKVIIEDVLNPIGSCCDDGRFLFKSCGNWWYNCPTYGLHNYTTWMRFGSNGFTLPLGTPHQARCIYSKHKVLCPIPSSCKLRSPNELVDLCEEIPVVIHVP